MSGKVGVLSPSDFLDVLDLADEARMETSGVGEGTSGDGDGEATEMECERPSGEGEALASPGAGDWLLSRPGVADRGFSCSARCSRCCTKSRSLRISSCCLAISALFRSTVATISATLLGSICDRSRSDRVDPLTNLPDCRDGAGEGVWPYVVAREGAEPHAVLRPPWSIVPPPYMESGVLLLSPVEYPA